MRRAKSLGAAGLERLAIRAVELAQPAPGLGQRHASPQSRVPQPVGRFPEQLSERRVGRCPQSPACGLGGLEGGVPPVRLCERPALEGVGHGSPWVVGSVARLDPGSQGPRELHGPRGLAVWLTVEACTQLALQRVETPGVVASKTVCEVPLELLEGSWVEGGSLCIEEQQL